MKVLLVVSILSAIIPGQPSFIPASQETILNIIKGQVKVLYLLLAKECPHLNFATSIDKGHPDDVTVQKTLYEKLLTEYVQCSKQDTENTTKAETITKSGSTTTMPSTQATSTTVPMECHAAINYTESWRQDHNGSEIKPGGPYSYDGYACDFHANQSQWFRFGGAAGNRMLDSCPERLSCGTYVPYWTDEVMPQDVGVERTIWVYGASYGKDCKWYSQQVQVMRCSWDSNHDLVYKQTTDYTSTCNEAFCGII